MVSIGAARVVLLLAGLWRAPEETGVRNNLEQVGKAEEDIVNERHNAL